MKPETPTSSHVETVPQQYSFYTNTTATIRSCASTKCSPLGTFPVNTVFDLPHQSFNELPEWIEFNYENKEHVRQLAYMHRSLLDRRPTTIQSVVTRSSVGKDTISASDLDALLTSVVEVTCGYSGEKSSTGSGTILKRDDGYYVLTNRHVAFELGTPSYCRAYLKDKDGVTDGPSYDLDLGTIFIWNNKADASLLKLGTQWEPSKTNRPVAINSKIFDLSFCPEKVPNGSPVILIGFPAYGAQKLEIGGYAGMRSSRIISNGIVSGYSDTALIGEGMPAVNYFVSAKIDSGNSGGIALSKTPTGSLCILGLPTWLTVGNYETQGLVQNIYNVVHKF